MQATACFSFVRRGVLFCGITYRKVAPLRSSGSGNGQLNRQKWSTAQNPMTGIDWVRAHTYSIGHGQPPLNHGTKHAVALTGQLPGAVNGNAMAACALVKFRYVDPQDRASIFRRSRPEPDWARYCDGRLTARFRRPPCG